MEGNDRISLGFNSSLVPEGSHLCLVFTSEEERRNSLLKFLLAGLANNEKVACFSERITELEIKEYLAENGVDYDERKDKNAISLAGTGEVYFAQGRFDPERMLITLQTFYQSSKEEGFPHARVIGEMVPEVQKIPGGDRLLEYESRVTQLVRDFPVTSVCQYDANLFDGATIMNVLKVHPMMLVNGQVMTNPFFVQPEEYLSSGKL